MDGWLPVHDEGDGDKFWVSQATGEALWLHPGTGLGASGATVKARAPPHAAWGASAAERYFFSSAAVAVQRVVRGHLDRERVRGWVRVGGGDVFYYNVGTGESRWRPPWRR